MSKTYFSEFALVFVPEDENCSDELVQGILYEEVDELLMEGANAFYISETNGAYIAKTI